MIVGILASLWKLCTIKPGTSYTISLTFKCGCGDWKRKKVPMAKIEETLKQMFDDGWRAKANKLQCPHCSHRSDIKK